MNQKRVLLYEDTYGLTPCGERLLPQEAPSCGGTLVGSELLHKVQRRRGLNSGWRLYNSEAETARVTELVVAQVTTSR